MLIKRRRTRPIPAGAEIFERGGQWFARWVAKTGQSFLRPLTEGRDRIVSESREWYVRLTDPATGQRRQWRAYRDKTASKARELELLCRLERKQAGLHVPDGRAQQQQRPVAEHLADFQAFLEDKGNSWQYIEKTVQRVRKLCEAIGANRLVEISAEGIEQALARWRREGQSVGTSNHYLRAIKNFCRWAVRKKRLVENPLLDVSLMRQSEATTTRRRRNLSEREFLALIEAARKGKTVLGLTGPDRVALYTVAVNTGLRASELASLKPESFDLGLPCHNDLSRRSTAKPEARRAKTEPVPAVRCLGAYTKNGKEAVLPLRPEVVRLLHDFLKDKPAGQPVWNPEFARQRRGGQIVRADLEAAGIPYKDQLDRYADFHSLRHTFITNLARSGVHPKTAQLLARHSTIDLTMNVYTHADLNELATAVGAGKAFV